MESILERTGKLILLICQKLMDSCLQLWVDTFNGRIEAFPCCSEQAKEVIKILIHEIIPRFGLPRSLQSDNASSFKAAVPQGVSKALGIEYHLHCSWRSLPQDRLKKLMTLSKDICAN